MTSFTSLTFLFRFLPIFLIVYYIFPAKHRNTILLLGSMVFYAFGEPVFILLLIFLTWINYFIGNQMLKERSGNEIRRWHQAARKRYLIGIVILDALVLVVCKTLGVFVSDSFFPLGISFYIFKMISYQADLYQGKISDQPGFLNTALYLMVFPQIAQGPIMRYEEGHFPAGRTYTLEHFEDGLKYFVIGLAMKVLLADRLSILWNDLQMIGYQSISTPLAWLGAAEYSMQLYFDFWGYSLMASGLMMMLGFDFVENFHHPYGSKSISEFYRRWHMTLGSWFRDYIYFPMGGSHCKKSRMVRNLAVVWLLTGLWHGEGVNFLIWGALLGLLIIMEKLWYGKYLKKLPVLGHLYLIVLIPLSWMIFAITDLKQLGLYFSRLFPVCGNGGISVNTQDFMKYLWDYGILLAVGLLLCIPAVSEFYEKHKKHPLMIMGLLVLFWVSIYFVSSTAGNPFMYLKF